MKIKTLCPLILLTLTASLATAQQPTRCGGPNTALYVNWPMFQFDVCHTGYNPYESTLKPSNVRNLVVAWEYQVQDSVTSPAIVNSVVYFADNPGTVYAVNANTGTLLWRHATGAIISYAGAPAVVNGRVYFGANDDNVYALNAGTGELSVEVRHGFVHRHSAHRG